MPGPSGQEIEEARLKARFEEACRRAAERHQNRQEIARTHARLDELSAEAERLSLLEQMDSDEAWGAVQREWGSLRERSDALDPAIAERFAAADARVRLRAEERRAAAERTLRQHALRLEQLIDRATRRAAAEDLTLREADRIARELRAALDAPPQLPDHEQFVERLKAAQAVVGPKLHELREMDEWKRFANAAVQEELIARTEALRAKYGFDTPEGVKPEDLDKAAHELHEIQERWKQAADAPRSQAQTLWHRYRQAADPVQTKVREFFAQRVEERKGNLERKLVLIERAEALATSTDWIKTADELKKLQAEWQEIGPVPRQDTRVTWKRFRDACDAFFTRRNADLAERKETWAANLAKKEALCARAEELAASTDWERGASESEGSRPTGGMSGRCAATSPRSCGSASVRRATRSSIATNGATRSSSKPGRRIGKRSSPSSNRSGRHATPTRPSRTGPRSGATSRWAPARQTAPVPRSSRRRRPIPSSTRPCSSRSVHCAAAGTSRRRRCARAPIR